MDKNYNVAEICNIAGISKAMLYKLWKQQCGPKKIKIGSRSFVTSSSLTAWLKDLENKGTEGAK